MRQDRDAPEVKAEWHVGKGWVVFRLCQVYRGAASMLTPTSDQGLLAEIRADAGPGIGTGLRFPQRGIVHRQRCDRTKHPAGDIYLLADVPKEQTGTTPGLQKCSELVCLSGQFSGRREGGP